MDYAKIIGQFGAPGVSGVHGDADKAHGIQAQLGSFEHESGQVGLDRRDDTHHLLGNDRQHFCLDPVELIKTSPCSRTSQSFEKLRKIYSITI